MQDSTDFTDLCEKVDFFDFSTFPSKSVKSCMNGWTGLQVDLSELVASHLVYMNLNFHGHSFIIRCDISILLKSIKICKSRVVATLFVLQENIVLGKFWKVPCDARANLAWFSVILEVRMVGIYQDGDFCAF